MGLRLEVVYASLRVNCDGNIYLIQEGIVGNYRNLEKISLEARDRRATNITGGALTT